jgi:hypothetical protein
VNATPPEKPVNDDALGSLQTLVGYLDEIPEDVDLKVCPEAVQDILNYINLHCRYVLKQSKGEA